MSLSPRRPSRRCPTSTLAIATQKTRLNMRPTEKFSHLRFAVLLGAAVGLVAGCVIGPASTECGSTFSHSEMIGDDCVCEDGYDWCEPTIADDYTCCEFEVACASGSNNHLDNADNCVCDSGYTWCDPTDIDNLDCCPVGNEDGGTGSTSGDGDGDTGTGDGDGDTGTGDGVLPPDECEPEQEGSFWCTNTDSMGPIGSSALRACGSRIPAGPNLTAPAATTISASVASSTKSSWSTNRCVATARAIHATKTSTQPTVETRTRCSSASTRRCNPPAARISARTLVWAEKPLRWASAKR